MKITTIIPVFDTEKYLGEAIDSVLGQSRPPDEIVVVDDGSTDGSVAVARSYPQVTVIQVSRRGIGAARNRGVIAATGTHLAFLDADDVWMPHKLESQAAFLEAHADVDMVFGWTEQFHSPDLTDAERALSLLDPQARAGLLAGCCLMSRTAFDRVGPFETTWKVGEFISWFSRAQDLNLRHATLPEVLLRRRLHATNTGIRERASLDYVHILKAVLDRRRQRG